jgi:hypothetical protein
MVHDLVHNWILPKLVDKRDLGVEDESFSGSTCRRIFVEGGWAGGNGVVNYAVSVCLIEGVKLASALRYVYKTSNESVTSAK